MKTARKALMLILCAALLVSATVMGTLAYLTSETGVVTNTFTIGKVAITLDEAKVDAYGVPVANAARVYGNEYKMIGNQSYTKDPTVHIKEGSEPCYLFVKIDNEIAEIEAATTIASQMTANSVWTPVADGSNIYYYKDVVDAREAQQDVEVFKTFTLKSDADLDEYAGKTIKVQAYAVQKEGFSSALDAWSKAPLAAWTTTPAE